jgi:hypothetical protein
MWREPLGFSKVVQEEFLFLVKDYYFKCTVAETTYVRFESDRVFINIYHGRSSFEIGLEIGLLDRDEPYSLSELIHLGDSKEGNSYRNFMAGTPELVRRGITLLREKFEKYGIKALSGAAEFFSKLHHQGKQLEASFSNQMKVRHTRPKADEAFHQKNYKEVVRLYESMLNALTPAELKKLEYSRRHAASD